MRKAFGVKYSNRTKVLLCYALAWGLALLLPYLALRYLYPYKLAGTAPAYILGGTIQRDGDTIRVITRMVNERSGETVWSNTANYDGNEASRVPRHIAVDAGNVVRCGLFGASTYHKALPDAGLTPAKTPDFELYDQRFDARTGNGTVEIWIPLA